MHAPLCPAGEGHTHLPIVCVWGGGGGRGEEITDLNYFFLNAQAEWGSYAAHTTPKSAHITPEQPHSLVCLHNSHLCLRCKPHIFNCGDSALNPFWSQRATKILKFSMPYSFKIHNLIYTEALSPCNAT